MTAFHIPDILNLREGADSWLIWRIENGQWRNVSTANDWIAGDWAMILAPFAPAPTPLCDIRSSHGFLIVFQSIPRRLCRDLQALWVTATATCTSPPRNRRPPVRTGAAAAVPPWRSC
jgi:hypothetical protein